MVLLPLGLWVYTEKGNIILLIISIILHPEINEKKLKCTLLNEVCTLPFGGLFMGGQLLDFRKEREDY